MVEAAQSPGMIACTRCRYHRQPHVSVLSGLGRPISSAHGCCLPLCRGSITPKHWHFQQRSDKTARRSHSEKLKCSSSCLVCAFIVTLIFLHCDQPGHWHVVVSGHLDECARDHRILQHRLPRVLVDDASAGQQDHPARCLTVSFTTGAAHAWQTVAELVVVSCIRTEKDRTASDLRPQESAHNAQNPLLR